MREIILQYLFKSAKKNKNIYFLTADLGFNFLEKYLKKLPNQFLNVGISEQNMISVAAGLAKEGKKVFVYSIANFPTLRTLEFVRNNLCYHNLNVTIIANGAGFHYGTLGFTHHLTEDISYVKALPNISIYNPGTDSEAIWSLKKILKSNKTNYIRLGTSDQTVLKNHDYNSYLNNKFKLTKSKNIIFCTGTILSEAIKAKNFTQKKIQILSFPKIKPIVDLKRKFILKKKLQHIKNIITIEENNIVGGFGSSILELLSNLKIMKNVIRIGINDKFSKRIGTQEYLRYKNKLHFKYIAKIINKIN